MASSSSQQHGKCKGILCEINLEKEVGFILTGPELTDDQSSRRIFFQMKDFCGDRPEVGEEVHFILRDGKPSAKRVWRKQDSPTKSDRDGTFSRARRDPGTFRGVVEIADPSKLQWGYITATEPLPVEFEGKMLLFKQEDVKGGVLNKSELVQFSLVPGSESLIPQVQNVRRIKEQGGVKFSKVAKDDMYSSEGKALGQRNQGLTSEGSTNKTAHTSKSTEQSGPGKRKLENILRHRGRILCIIEEEGHGYIKPAMELPPDYAQNKDVFFSVKEVAVFGIKLAPGDELEFTLGTKNKQKPRAMRPKLVKCKRRDVSTIEGYLAFLLQQLQLKVKSKLHREMDLTNVSVVHSSCPVVWEMIGNCRTLTDDSVFMILAVLRSFDQNMKEHRQHMIRLLTSLSNTLFLNPWNGPLKGYLERKTTNMTSVLADAVQSFSLSVFKYVPEKSRAIVTLLKPLMTCETGKYEQFIYQLLQQTVRRTADCIRDMEWDELPQVPGGEELLGRSLKDTVSLKPVIVKGPYATANDYMDRYFRLLWTDCFSNLQDGIRDFLEGELDHRDMNVYHSVRLEGIRASNYNEGLALVLHVVPVVPVKDWSSASNLMFGNLLCLSSTGTFRDPVWATVVNRDVGMLESRGLITVELVSECNKKTDSEVILSLARGSPSMILAESPTYYMAYQPVLAALQKLDLEELPFKKILVDLGPPEPPLYIPDDVDEEIEMALSCKYLNTEYVCQSLDPSQAAALNLAIRNNIGIIQGPPGTGKTFLGIKILKHILDHAFGRRGPILVLTYKNHALDEFLKQAVEDYPGDVVRVGGRSTEPKLMQCNLNELKREQKAEYLSNEVYQLRAEAEELKMFLKRAGQKLEQARYFTSSKLLAHLNSDQIKAFLSGVDVNRLGKKFSLLSCKIDKMGMDAKRSSIKRWLDGVWEMKGEGLLHALQKQNSDDIVVSDLLKLFKQAYDQWVPSEDVFTAVENQYTQTVLPVKTKPAKNKNSTVHGDEKDIKEEEKERMSSFRGLEKSRVQEEIFAFQTSTSTKTFKPNLFASANKIFEQVSDIHLLCVQDIWTLSSTERVCLIQLVLLKQSEEPISEFENILQQYQINCKSQSEIENLHKSNILKSKKIIGMTITGASLNQNLLEKARPETVIVEEAGEVLEPHLVAVLGSWVHHLILIGDHEQLKPTVETYALSKHYKFDTSLMERLVKNKFPYATLEMQNRMRPEFAELLLDIYPDLKSNLKRVSQNIPPPCVGKSMFYWHHTHPEEKDRSIINEGEAERAVRLALFFIQQGYEPSKITILGAYKGQVRVLRENMRDATRQYPELFIYNSKDKLKRSGDKDKHNPRKDEVVIQTIDNYQGDENDIVIVSLVRSFPANGSIGYLKVRNRRCVAQSRARCGMYFIGNQATFANDGHWAELLTRMSIHGCVGETLMLHCPRHPKTSKIYATKASDITLKDFCREPCQEMMDCKRHFCNRTCQPNHKHAFCRSQVRYTFPHCRHTIVKECYIDPEELRCEQKVPYTFPSCGHHSLRPCFSNPEHLKCKAPCPRVLTCKHPCEGKCGDECSDDTCRICEKIRAEEKRIRRQAEECDRKRARADAEKEIKRIKSLPFLNFYKTNLEPEGDTAEEYYSVADKVVKYIQPTHKWFPTVTAVERVTNHKLEIKWLDAKADMADPTRNELKFHGTGTEGVEGIITNGFRLPEKAGMYGRGVYFATDSSKSAQEIYTKGSNMLLLCDVLLGRSMTVSSEKPNMTLMKLRRDHYDSVYAKRGTRQTKGVLFDEFIVYNPDQALPRYVVHYVTTSTQMDKSCNDTLTASMLAKGGHQSKILKATRGVDLSNPEDVHFRIAESQFLRLSPGRGIKHIEYHVDKTLTEKFKAKCREFKGKYKGSEEADYILAFHGTKVENTQVIMKTNFKMDKISKNTGNMGHYGRGIYFSEFPRTSIGYSDGEGLILCKVLPGRSYVCQGLMMGAELQHGYDSHIYLQDEKGRGKELVIFDPDQILPCYVIALA